MYGLIATLRIDPAKADAFEKDFEQFARQVREKEPDALAYHLGKSGEEPGVYHVIEVYRSEDALKAHLSTDEFKLFRPKMVDALIAPPESKKFDILI